MGVPGADDGGQEMGAAADGPNPMVAPDQAPPEGGAPPAETPPAPEGGAPAEGGTPPPPGGGAAVFSDPTEAEIDKYDLEIQGYASEQDHEDRDFSEER